MHWGRVCRQVVQSASTNPSRANGIAFIGLGRMGSEMAFNLFSKTFANANTKETKFTIFDAVNESAFAFAGNFTQHFPGAQLEVVYTPSEAVLAAKTVITMLPSSPQVRAVYTEASGILSGLRALEGEEAKDTLCIDSTTLDVDVARTVSSRIHEAGALMIDAPVSGGVTGAKAGTLSFMVGGTSPEFDLASPLLSLMGSRSVHCGPSGAGLAAKICNNLVLAAEQIVVAEAMLMGERLGLKPSVLASVINTSTGGCWASSVNNPVPSALVDKSPPCERNYEGGFATELMLKDLNLALQSAAATGTSLPIGNTAHRVYEDVIERQPELARKDFSSVYEYLRAKRRAGSRM